jgi:hypothetical protein
MTLIILKKYAIRSGYPTIRKKIFANSYNAPEDCIWNIKIIQINIAAGSVSLITATRSAIIIYAASAHSDKLQAALQNYVDRIITLAGAQPQQVQLEACVYIQTCCCISSLIISAAVAFGVIRTKCNTLHIQTPVRLPSLIKRDTWPRERKQTNK